MDRIVWLTRLTVILCGAIQAWSSRFDLNPDGISYLDLADLYREGRWEDATNAHWSPLYPLLLALALGAFRVTRANELPVVHALNFAIFLGALVMLELLLRELSVGVEQEGDALRKLVALRLWAYALFAWTMIAMIHLSLLTPDLLIAVFVFGSAAQLARIRRGDERARTHVVLGLTMGLAYLAKSAMFVLAWPFLLSAIVLSPRKRFVRGLYAIAAYGLVTLPAVAMLSLSKGRLTFGDAGRVAYAWNVGGVRAISHWQGGPEGAGTPIHPTKLVHVNPELFTFSEPIGGTYPVWLDPAYWYEGVRLRVDLPQQARVLARSTALYLRLLAPVIFAAVVLIALCNGWRGRPALSQWWLVVPGLCALAMYGLVLVEPRYVAPFVVLICLGVFLGTLSRLSSRELLATGAAGAITLFGLTFLELTPNRRRLLPSTPNPLNVIATALRGAGIQPGDRVALVGDGAHAYWARAAAVRIVAEVPPYDAAAFWAADATVQGNVFHLMAQAGAKALVATSGPPQAVDRGWHRVGDTALLLRHFNAQTRSAPPTPP